VYSQGELKYIFIIITPGLDLSSVNNAVSELNISAPILQLLLDGPENPDYYVYWLLLGRKPEFDNVTLLSELEYELINNYTERISSLWGNAVLVDIPVVNPEFNISAINTQYNLTLNAIRPGILEIETNNTVYWDMLKTNITVVLRDVELRVTLNAYNVTYIITNITISKILAPKPINITGVEGITNGVYYIGFYVLEADENKVKLLFPGSLRTTGFMSGDIKPIEAQLVPWTLIYKYLDFYSNLTSEARELVFNLTISTTQRLITRAIWDTDKRIHIIYAPHALVAKLLDVDDNRTRDFVGMIISPINITVKGYLLVLFNPVVDAESGFALHYGNYTALSDLEFTVSQYISILLSFSKLSPIQSSQLLEEFVNMRNRVVELEANVSGLSRSLEDLNSTLQETTNKLTQCESTRDILEYRLRNINEELQHAEELKKTGYIYITSGLLITIAIATLLGFFTMRTCRVITPRLKRT